jgi:hypothetical protein
VLPVRGFPSDTRIPAMTTATNTPRRRPARDNILVSLLFNIVLPGFVLSKLSGEDRLGPVLALACGIAFPLAYGIRDLAVKRKWNPVSLVGLASVTLTGGFALAEVDGFWFAVKEASIPTLFGIAILATLGTERPLVRMFVLNESVFDVPRIEDRLDERGTRPEFEGLLRQATLWMSGGFALSAVLNFVLARVLLKSPGGTPEFTAELGRMTWLSWPVIAVPTMLVTAGILWRLLAGIQRLTGLQLEELMHGDHGSKAGDAR